MQCFILFMGKKLLEFWLIILSIKLGLLSFKFPIMSLLLICLRYILLGILSRQHLGFKKIYWEIWKLYILENGNYKVCLPTRWVKMEFFWLEIQHMLTLPQVGSGWILVFKILINLSIPFIFVIRIKISMKLASSQTTVRTEEK